MNQRINKLAMQIMGNIQDERRTGQHTNVATWWSYCTNISHPQLTTTIFTHHQTTGHVTQLSAACRTKNKTQMRNSTTDNRWPAAGMCETLGRSLKRTLMTRRSVHVTHLVIKLNVDEGKITTTTIHFTLPLTVYVHCRHQNNVANLSQSSNTIH